MLKLYYSANSPYARIVRIAVHEAAAVDRVEMIEVVTRTPDNPVLEHSPLGRVPTLVTDTFVLGESRLIYQYLQENFGNGPNSTDWEKTGLESMVTGFMDGIAVWGRESMFHTKEGVSEVVLNLERERATRCMAYFESLWKNTDDAHPWDFARIALACALDLLGMFGRMPDWQTSYPNLAKWHATVAARPSMSATAPVIP